MNDYEILKYLGLEIRNQNVIFYDDESEEHVFDFSSIKDISIEEAYAPIDKKLSYWINKLFVIRKFSGVIETKTDMEDYRDIYELEIELDNNQVISRKVKYANINELKEFVAEINRTISNSYSLNANTNKNRI